MPYFMHIEENNENNGLFSVHSLGFTAQHGVIHEECATAREGKGERYTYMARVA